MHSKFIIENDNLILMKVDYHIEIVSNEKDVKGGGWYRQNNKTQSITFYGKSEAFGAAKFMDIKKCVEEGKVFTDKNLTICFARKYQFFYESDSKKIHITTLTI